MEGLKAGWRRVRFGDVVKLNQETSKDPAADGLDRYVGLEHIEPGDLRIRSWGEIADGTTFTNRFRPGQVLFGKRRAYQRKVAVADFDGICSGDIYVLESRDPNLLLPELLPFICQTDGFFEHAVATSAGSLSPRTNWKSLAEYEFTLPALEEQQPILSLLQKAESNVLLIRAAMESLEKLRYSLSIHRFLGTPLAETVTGRDLIRRKALSLQTGPFGSVLKASAYQSVGVPIINPVNITNGKMVFPDGPFLGEDDRQRLAKYWMMPGDVVMGRKRHMHKLVYVEQEHEGFVVGSDCIRFRVDKAIINPRYFFYFLKSWFPAR